LATPVADAVRAASRAYVQDPAADVEAELRLGLARGGAVLDDGTVLALARAVRAGRSEELTRDASTDPDPT